MKNKILTGLLLVLIGGWGSLSAQNVGSNYARQVNTLIGTKGPLLFFQTFRIRHQSVEWWRLRAHGQLSHFSGKR